MNQRKSGVLLHISSLPCEYGIGDFGPSAYHFVDFLKNAGQKYWQILPLNPIDAISSFSPYTSCSAFAINTLFISPQLLLVEGFIEEKDLKLSSKFNLNKVEYKKVARFKQKLLDKSFKRYQEEGKLFNEFQKFKKEQKAWLDDFALYSVIKDNYKGKPWNKWPASYKNRDRNVLKNFQKKHTAECERIKFFQFLVDRQWQQLKRYSKGSSVEIVGDMPIYVNYDSVDVWKNTSIFKLDKKLKPFVVSGVPPDYFCEDGQLWGNPVYDWGKLKKQEYSWWIDRVKRNLAIYDYVRIDHFRGLVQYWEISAKEKTAKNGQWVDVPTKDFLDKLKMAVDKSMPIIAEDLGTITQDVRDIINEYQLPGMKVLLFAFNGDMDFHPYLPHNFQKNCIVYTGTHDNNTVKGWFKKEATLKEKENLKWYVNQKLSVKSIYAVFVKMAMDSNANTVIIPLQDLLGLDESARMNVPGKAKGNWVFRAKTSYFSEKLANDLLQLVKRTGRY